MNKMHLKREPGIELELEGLTLDNNNYNRVSDLQRRFTLQSKRRGVTAAVKINVWFIKTTITKLTSFLSLR